MGLAAFNRMRRLKMNEAVKTETPDDLTKLKINELKSRLRQLGVEIPEEAKREALIQLLQEALTRQVTNGTTDT